MAIDVRMPKLGVTMTTGVVTAWLKREGDAVAKGEPVVEITTEKIANEVEATGTGVLAKILVKEGDEVPVGELLGQIAVDGEDLAAEPVLEPAVLVAQMSSSQASPLTLAHPSPLPTKDGVVDGIKASPLAKKIAKENGVDLSAVCPSSGGRISREDVLAFIAARELSKERPAAATTPLPMIAPAVQLPPQGGRTLPMAGMRKAIADRLMASLHGAAQLTVANEVDVTELVNARALLLPGFEAATGLRPTFTDMLVVLVSRALLQHPILNSTLVGDQICLHDEVNMGVAVALENGLIVPVIPGAQGKSLGEITAARTDLVRKAKEGRLGPDEMSGGTFTITNPGTPGADISTPILNAPQNAILGIGRFVKKPAVHDDEICIRQICWLSVTFDHRVSDGIPVTHFLETLGGMLKEPLKVLSPR